MTPEEIIRKKEKEMMSPFRKKINYIFLPIYVGGFLVFTVVATVLGAIDAEKFFPVTVAWAIFLVLYGLSFFFIVPWINRTERNLELERYAWLFAEPAPLEKESVELYVEEDEISYTLTKDGLRAEWEQEGEQVFDEARENVHFIPWKDAEFTLASRTLVRRIEFALGVLFEVEEENRPANAEKAYGAYVVPLTEEVYQAICAFGLTEKMPIEWRYLFYNPKDAFGQILVKGMIDDFHDVETGKVIKEGEENF